MSTYKKIAFLFPGQGAQYKGMGEDFSCNFPVAKNIFDRADAILGRDLSSLIFNGPDDKLTETKNSQLAIFITSLAILSVINEQFPHIKPSFCAGLSLGEYTALAASKRLSFENGVSLVEKRGEFMNEACKNTKGTMAVVMGLEADCVSQLVKDVALPEDLFAANFNCPGQVVISGTVKGIEAGIQAAKAKGAKRVLPIQVHGAFHSGLMKEAEESLSPYIKEALITEGCCDLVMNVTGNVVKDIKSMRQNLIDQVTKPVLWEQSIRFLIEEDVDCFIEIGCGKVLAGFNKRINPSIYFISIEKIEDLALLDSLHNYT